MFNISKLEPSQRDFVLTFCQSGESRKEVATFAIAKYLSDGLQMPGTPVENIVTYFNTQFTSDIYSRLNTLNEMFPVDVEAIRDMTIKLYTIRYSMLHPLMTMFVNSTETALADIFRISRSLDVETIKKVTAAGRQVAIIYNNVATIEKALSGNAQ